MRAGFYFLILAALVCGCTRAWYRRSADRETYGIVAEHDQDPRWPVAEIGLDRPPASRLYDPYNPDRPPMPPDDPAADYYMRRPNGMRGSKHFHDDGDAPTIEADSWRQFLELDKDGKLVLTSEKSVELALLHSRDFQTNLETLYSTALALTLNRFEFDLHWFAGTGTVFEHFGSSDTESNTLTVNNQGGFTKMFAAGGQLMVEIANTIVIQFAGLEHMTTTTNLGMTFMQPLLRNAGRRVRLELLTQAERNVLYAVRTFARFRKTFAVNLTQAQGGFLSLLLQVQNIRNLEANLASLEQNLKLHEALFASGTVSLIQVDQVFQSYQQGKLSLLQARTALETSLDAFKIQLGLPPSVPVTLDEALLDPFQLNDPALLKLQEELETFFASYRELDQAPSLASLRSGFARLWTYQQRTLELLGKGKGELERWGGKIGGDNKDPAQLTREKAGYEALSRQFPELEAELKTLGNQVKQSAAALVEEKRSEGWVALQGRTRQLIASAAQIFVIQAQIRVYLIKLKPVRYTERPAVAYALDNRLDLMNQRGQVVDAWRQVAVAANQLRGDLNVTVSANVATQPFSDNPVDFRSSASSYAVGFQFDAPLNRLAERNLYRTSLINYQQARRAFMGLGDQITAAIRLDLRQLETERANFEIARISLVSAARQVEASRDRLLLIPNAADTTSTQDILLALNSLLSAKQTLIGSYTNYETFRVQLLLDMEALQLDDRGYPRDEPDDQPAAPDHPDDAAGPADRPGPAGAVEQLPAPRTAPAPGVPRP